MHPIFVALCGIISSYLAVFKSLTKRNFISLNVNDLKHIHPLNTKGHPQTGRLSEVNFVLTDSSSEEAEGEDS